MNFLLSLLFIILNILIGAIFMWLFRWLLFNRKTLHIFKKRLFLTPGIIPRFKNYLFRKIKDAVQDYFDQVDDFQSHQGYIYNWEQKVYLKIYDSTNFIDKARYIPIAVAEWIRNALAFIAKDLSSRFLRTFIPYMYEYYQIEGKIDLIEEKINLDIIKGYYNQYIHKYFMIFNLITFFIAGIFNQILYLILI